MLQVNRAVILQGLHQVIIAMMVITMVSGGFFSGNANSKDEDVSFIRHTIDDDFQSVAGIAAGDLNNDGHIDFVGAAIDANEIAYWSNNGGYPPVWTKHTIDSAYDDALYVHIADIDGDQSNDVIASGATSGQVAWWRNNGGNPLTWTKQVIKEEFDAAHGVYAADLDGDDDMDILATSAGLSTILWWENKGGSNHLSWLEHTIDDALGSTQTVCADDLDNDGDIDVIAGSSSENIVVWYRNDGGDPVDFTRLQIGDNFKLAHWVAVQDVDGDGDLDVLGASYVGSEIAWWKNSGGSEISWTKQTIGTGYKGALTVCTGDFDNDGNMDVIGTSNASRKFAWWRNNGAATIVWTEQVIDDNYRGAWPVCVADLDNDNDLDVVTGSDKLNQVTVWENTLLELELGVELILPNTHFVPGDEFQLDTMLSNPADRLKDVPIVTLMAIFDDYWFWPAWNQFDPDTGVGFDFLPQHVENGTTFLNIIPPFEWPDTGSQVVPDIQFMSAMLSDDMTALRGLMDIVVCTF